MKRAMFLFGVVLALLSARPVAAQSAAAPGAKEILERIASTYRGCRSYRDSGVVETTFIQPDRKWRVRKPFWTAFVRPDRFRFEFRSKTGGSEDEERYLIWRNGPVVKAWWDLKHEVERPGSLDLALAGATGVSGSSAHTIPALLMPSEVSGWRITNLPEATRIEDGSLGTVACFRVSGRVRNSPTILWIDKKSFLLRRIDAKIDFDKFRTEETTTYEPAIDGEVADSLLKFDPPVTK